MGHQSEYSTLVVRRRLIQLLHASDFRPDAVRLTGQFVGDGRCHADQQWSTGLRIDQQLEQGVMLFAARVDVIQVKLQ